jgi:hypothetical protein
MFRTSSRPSSPAPREDYDNGDYAGRDEYGVPDPYSVQDSYGETQDARTVQPWRRPPAPAVSRPRTTRRVPVPADSEWEGRDWDDAEGTLIVPAQQTHRSRAIMRMPTSAPLPAPVVGHDPRAVPRWSRWVRPAAFVLVLITVGIACGLHALQAAEQPPLPVSALPAPSGRGPWTANSGSVVIIAAAAPVTQTQQGKPIPASSIPFAIQPCQDAVKFIANITQWSVPPGCYANIYQPNPTNYVSRPGFGWCNWWVRVAYPDHPDITESLAYPRGTNPVAGAPIFFDGNEQGASSEGHWALAVAVSSDHYWVLISEMNFAWRGAGWGKLDYRYIHVSPHVHFVYTNP